MNIHYRHSRILGLAAVVFALAAAFSAAPVRAATSLNEEIEMGRKINIEILKQTPLSKDKAAQAEIQKIGQKLAKNGGLQRPQIVYHFQITKSNDLNAFTTPGGYIYFTERIWNVLRRDEITGVMAHEMIHSDRRHVIDAMSKMTTRRTILSLLLSLTKAGNLAGNAVGLLNAIHEMKYSRGDERQADELGTELLQKAGENPADLLLALRKIGRYEAQKGGTPPRWLSNHPLTRDRLLYLESLLTKMGVPIPPDQTAEVPKPDMIGTVAGVNGSSVDIALARSVKGGETVWLMKPGWDSHLENKTVVPFARAVVANAAAADRTVAARVWLMSNGDSKSVAKGVGVYAPPTPGPVSGVCRIDATTNADGAGKLSCKTQFGKLDRFFAVQVAWNTGYEKLVNDNVGYVTVTNPASPTGYIGINRPGFGYAPINSGVELVAVNDSDSQRYVGPVASVGMRDRDVEVIPNRALSSDKTYEVVEPAWSADDTYETRVVAQASLKSATGKIVLSVVGFTPGWGIDSGLVGFDVYEAKPPKK